MKSCFRWWLFSVFCALGLAQAFAQTNTNVVAFHTNAFINTTLNLKAYVRQPGQTDSGISVVKTQQLSTKDVINAIALDLGRGTNDLRGAKLLLRTVDVGSTNEQSPGFVLRVGTNDTDVSSYLNITPATNYFTTIFGFYVSTLSSVATERVNPSNSSTNVNEYTIYQVTLNTTNASFDVQGLVNVTFSSVFDKGHVIRKAPFPNTFNVSVAGSGAVAGKSAVFQGTVTASARKIEVQSF
jgi:hypothetical protein